MQQVSVGSQLNLVEQQLNDAMRCLNEGDSQALTEVSVGLQSTAMELVQLMHTHRRTAGGQQFAVQIGQLAQRLISLRENLVRRSAYVDRALSVVLPASDVSTYQRRGPYGYGVKSSGSMNVFAA